MVVVSCKTCQVEFKAYASENRNRNLVICQDKAYHQLLHVLDRVRRAGGRPFEDVVCTTCQLAKPPSAFDRCSRGRHGVWHYCKECRKAAYHAAKQAGGDGVIRLRKDYSQPESR